MEAIDEFWTNSFRSTYAATRVVGDIREGFQYYLKIPLEGDTIEVPAIAKRAAVFAKLDGYKNLIIPLVKTQRGFLERRQSSRMLKDFSRQGGRVSELVGVKSTKGDKYYGMPGIICDEDMHLIVLCTCVIDINTEHRLGFVRKINACFDYSVFENTDKILEKTFYRQFMSSIRNVVIDKYMVTDGPTITYSAHLKESLSVVIENIDSRFKVKPDIPIPGTNFEDAINEDLRALIDAKNAELKRGINEF